MKVEIIKTTERPLYEMGEVAGICYDQTKPERFVGIAKRCLAEGHHRVAEIPDVIFKFTGCSAKLVREWYTHIVGTTRLQSSTRYIDYSKQFEFVTPNSITSNPEALQVWNSTMEVINDNLKTLKELEVPVEDFTNILPLAYQTTFVCKINLRALMSMFNVRACTCAYHEYRELMRLIKKELKAVSEEWNYITDVYFVPKCEISGFCNEATRCCGRKPCKE